MRCLNCGRLCFKTICTICQNHLLGSELNSRTTLDGFKIYSFFNYSEIKNLLHSKHHFHGSFVIKALAKISFAKFAKKFKFQTKINAVAIDDRIKFGYSHTAILANCLKSDSISPIFSCLHSTNDVSYSGKNLIFRIKNPRNFKLLKKPKFPVILVDDVITTGTTIQEARICLQNAGCDVLFALVLADAKY